MAQQKQTAKQIVLEGMASPLLCKAAAPAETALDRPEFPQFRLLPAELRIEIWKAAIEEPRIVHVGIRKQIITASCVTFNGHLCMQVVGLFQVNRESRSIAFGYPFIHFSVRPDPDDSEEAHFLVTRNDIVSMGEVCPLTWYSGTMVFSCHGDSQSIRHLMINWDTRALALELQFHSVVDGLNSILRTVRQCMKEFGNGASLQNVYCLMQEED
ncbi:hypothetical protein SLS62_007817 [Diatrype stigma]|uniref:2EXR domain-containing protein n=1 Tax=Diatrype stigma TaxID=117547 RepID=A0AAN9ULF3_9PEZI